MGTGYRHKINDGKDLFGQRERIILAEPQIRFELLDFYVDLFGTSYISALSLQVYPRVEILLGRYIAGISRIRKFLLK